MGPLAPFGQPRVAAKTGEHAEGRQGRGARRDEPRLRVALAARNVPARIPRFPAAVPAESDDPVGAERPDLLFRVAGRAQDLVGVLAE